MYANQVGSGYAEAKDACAPREPDVMRWLAAAESEASRLGEVGGLLVERLSPVLSVGQGIAKNQAPSAVPSPLPPLADRLRSLTDRLSIMADALNATRNALEI